MNIVAITLAVLVQFGIGAVWYTALFGKLWGKIHGFHKLPKAEQDAMVKSMGPFYALQFGVTILTTVILAMFVNSRQDLSPYLIAGLVWFGFVLPTQVSAVIFSNTPRKWMAKQIVVMAGAAFFCLEAAAFVFHFFI